MAMPLDRLNYVDQTRRSVVYRLPPVGSAELAEGAKLTVQDQQLAVFFRGGQACDQFGPGTHDLTTTTLPRLAAQSKGDALPNTHVYFLGAQTFRHQKWGTKHPIPIQDEELGGVNVRGFGSYGFRIADAERFLHELVERQARFSSAEVHAFLQERIVNRLARQLQDSITRLLDLPNQYDNIVNDTAARLQEEFAEYGLRLEHFFINSLAPPQSIQDAIDQHHGAVFEDLRTFTLAQTSANPARASEGGSIIPAPNQAVASADSENHIAIDELQPASRESVQELVRAVISSTGWQLIEANSAWQVTVPIGSLRKQHVTIDFSRSDNEGHNLICFTSTCGPVDPKIAMSLLRRNVNMVHGAFAIESSNSGEMVVVQGNQLADTADALEVTRILAAVAWQADRAEQQLLLGGDEF